MKNLIHFARLGVLALLLMFSVSAVHAQTTASTTDMSGGVMTTTSVVTPGVPTTGMGGNTALNLTLLSGSALLIITGVWYSRRSPHQVIRQ